MKYDRERLPMLSMTNATDPPAMNPVNLGLRFILELAAMLSVGYWGLVRFNLWIAGLCILVFVLLWAIFNVPGDPSRSGKAPVRVPGLLRLALEVSLFAWAAWGLGSLGLVSYSRYLGMLLILHYIFSWRRILWLLRIRSNGPEAE